MGCDTTACGAEGEGALSTKGNAVSAYGRSVRFRPGCAWGSGPGQPSRSVLVLLPLQNDSRLAGDTERKRRDRLASI